MADPRAIAELEGIRTWRFTRPIDDDTITYDADEENGSAQVGLAVTINSSEQAALTADATWVAGKLVKVESDGFAVIERGFVTLPAGAGASLTNGKAIVGDLDTAAKGYIREVATGTAAELGVQDGRIIDPTDTAAVLVYLP
jgi:hypothetical protein